MADKVPTVVDLELLASFESGGSVTQMSLSRHIGISVGLVNALLKRAMRKGGVKAKAAPYKGYSYFLSYAERLFGKGASRRRLSNRLTVLRPRRSQAMGFRHLELRG